MKRFKDVLVFANGATEPSKLLDDARELAQRNDARITIYDVVPSLPARRRFAGRARELDLQEMVVKARREQLQELAASDEAVEVDSGTAFVEVITKVMNDGHDLIMTTPEPTRRKGLAGATTTLHLLRKSPVPVLVGQDGTAERRDVAVAIGPLEQGASSLRLHTTLIELAGSLAARRKGELHVIHAWRLPGESLMRGYRSGISDDEISGLLDEARQDAEASLKDLLETALRVSVPHRLHIHKGDAADVITSVLDEEEAGVLVMGTLARAGISGVIIGNTAEKVLDGVDASVLAVKPPGFISPVVA